MLPPAAWLRGRRQGAARLLTHIKAAWRKSRQSWVVVKNKEDNMANTPVEVKRSAPAPVPATDSWQAFRTEMDRLFDRFGFGMKPFRSWFDLEPAAQLRTSFEMPSPAIDIVEEPTGYKLTAELPGMAEKDIEVAVSGNTVTLKGEKKQESERKDKNYTLSERSYGSFQRTFTLPDGVDRDKISAEFSKGVLTLSLPKNSAAVAEPKKIEVKAAA
jgi:HSP20 family protein